MTSLIFEELLARKEPFTLKVDFRGLAPPLEELDIVILTPARASELPPGTLVLRRLSDGLEFSWVASGNHASWTDFKKVARVMQVERPGALIRLDSLRWRLVEYLLVRLPGFSQAYERWWQLRPFLGSLLHPFHCPLSIGSPEKPDDRRDRKYSYPDEVKYQAKRSREGLEDGEEQLFVRHLHPPARLPIVGCGAGREAIALTKRGFHVVGIDPAQEFIAAARREGEAHELDATFEAKAGRDMSYPAASFDEALCLPAVYQHTPTRHRRIDLLKDIGHVLTPEAILVLCVGWHSGAGPRLALIDGLRRLIRRLLGEPFSTEPGDRLIRHLICQ